MLCEPLTPPDNEFVSFYFASPNLCRPCLYALAATMALSAGPLRAEDFAIELKVRSGRDAQAVELKYPIFAKERPVFSAAADAPITVKWTLRRAEKASPVKDVLVHFFVVKVEKLNQHEAPKLTQNVVAESALTMDFKALDKAEGQLSFTIPRAGVYLLRLELKGAPEKDGREPSVSLDLQVR